jgi:hypothetical protein
MPAPDAAETLGPAPPRSAAAADSNRPVPSPVLPASLGVRPASPGGLSAAKVTESWCQRADRRAGRRRRRDAFRRQKSNGPTMPETTGVPTGTPHPQTRAYLSAGHGLSSQREESSFNNVRGLEKGPRGKVCRARQCVSCLVGCCASSLLCCCCLLPAPLSAGDGAVFRCCCREQRLLPTWLLLLLRGRHESLKEKCGRMRNRVLGKRCQPERRQLELTGNRKAGSMDEFRGTRFPEDRNQATMNFRVAQTVCVVVGIALLVAIFSLMLAPKGGNFITGLGIFYFICITVLEIIFDPGVLVPMLFVGVVIYIWVKCRKPPIS